MKLRIEIDLAKVATYADLRAVLTQMGEKGSPSMVASSLTPRELRAGRTWLVKVRDEDDESGYAVVGYAEVAP